mmetsp:Transcript_16199/g.30743  ORF Transcript_16199/g.30743 Transcript_16199/m.30743 type:complete len:318 (-) Transcript_16199:131-1084(-)|eukprot:CAMPEP_0170197688 /NCGR_PEP_ID=MMETSP0040_2-20121228/66951_1 /TAXON_ID=641309 /ORGANISM="Lotharella oceanica, Strain CCMP622" /LENGTH=317 /DNA_ID=CAMNT_0010447413 /DNA_START=97 /DNA_END=1050 /DNA_ORIENTATION=-
MSKKDGAMLLIPRTNQILELAVKSQLTLAQEVKSQDPNLDAKEKKKLSPVSMTFNDFEHSSYRVSMPKGSSVLTISLNLPCFKEIEGQGVSDMLKEKYGEFLVDTEKGYDVSIAVDVNSPSQPIETITELVVNLKEAILTAPLIKYFKALVTGSPESVPFSFNLREDTKMFICPARDRVTVVLKLSLQDPVDLQVAEIFLKDYKEVQRRKAGGAPPALFSLNAPEEIAGEGKGSLGFISFAVQQRQMKDMQTTAAALINFRSFLQYHLKCSKSFFHSRMRKKVKEFLMILNRAKTDYDGETKKKAKKTASGRVFKKA